MRKIVLAFCVATAWFGANTVAQTYIQQDSITRNKQDFAYLVAYTEANYAAFPAIIQAGYAAPYQAMKDSLGLKISTK